ncbi:RING-type E3 ubiquitin transferase [Ranunculus cassubicifolius]
MAVEAKRHFSDHFAQDLMMDAFNTSCINGGAGFNDFSSSSLEQYQHQPMGFSQSSLAFQLEEQRQEIDRFILLQNERLRITMEEERKRQQFILLRRLESKALILLKQKYEELAKENRKTLMLEDCIRKVEMEKQAWQSVAKESESMVIALSNTLEQVGVEDADTCCSQSSSSNRATGKMSCKVCNTRPSCVVILPCRHLCSCKSCESLLDYCPVCKSVKKACINVFMS